MNNTFSKSSINQSNRQFVAPISTQSERVSPELSVDENEDYVIELIDENNISESEVHTFSQLQANHLATATAAAIPSFSKPEKTIEPIELKWKITPKTVNTTLVSFLAGSACAMLGLAVAMGVQRNWAISIVGLVAVLFLLIAIERSLHGWRATRDANEFVILDGENLRYELVGQGVGCLKKADIRTIQAESQYLVIGYRVEKSSEVALDYVKLDLSRLAWQSDVRFDCVNTLNDAVAEMAQSIRSSLENEQIAYFSHQNQSKIEF